MRLPNLSLASVVLCLGLTTSTALADPLEAGFINPPDSAKPHTWWQWMNGNITKEGITADLEAMKQIGLGGATVVNLDCGIPRGDTPFMSPEWQEDFRFAVLQASRLGFDLSVENCAGWSSSGGPWNTTTNAMQCLTASETQIAGPTNFDAILPQPPTTLNFYRDIAVLAYKANTAVASGVENLEIKRAVYGADGGGSADVTAKIVAMIKDGRQSIMVGNDEMGGDSAPDRVKQLRVEYTLNGTPGTASVDEGKMLIYSPGEKPPFSSGSGPSDQTFVRPTAIVPDAGEAIPRKGILDLTAKLNADGRLKWNVPRGNWIIIRLGYTPIGMDNHPAPEEGTGLECDKFSKAALDAHWDGFMQKVLDDVGPLAGKTLKSSFIDSYEVGNQDWSANFRQEFEKRRGYDPLKYLPTYTGCTVENPEVTRRFLWDMRRTIADLFADNYYGHFAELCREHGLASDVEPYTGPYESLQCGQPEDTVMGEYWTGSQGDPSVKLASSVAHIYGKTLVGAESFTAGEDNAHWQNDPYAQKTLGDLMFCQGVNRYYFHRYAMQPWMNRWPGMTMGPWGFNFERTITWWTQGKAWIDYISHCEFLLQQGSRVADAAYFDGQSAPVEMPDTNPPLPPGYDYDAVNTDVLQSATVINGRLTLASGANYAMLILPSDDINMTPQMLQCLRKLVRAGATVIGPRPQHSPSLADYPRCDVQVEKLAAQLWGKCDGTNIQENNYGQGHVVWGKSPGQIFASQNLRPDFQFLSQSAATQLAFTHRSTGDADIYFVSNQRREFDSANCIFRVSGKIPELWHPDTGVIEPAPIWNDSGSRTTVQLNFDPAGSVFVIFRRATTGVNHVLAASGVLLSPDLSHVPKLEIQRAILTATDGAGEKDVTEKVSALVQAGQPVIAGNDLAGRDPAPFHQKELRVDYTLDGRPCHATARENETLMLLGFSAGLAPHWETTVTTDGSPAIKTWDNGRFNLYTSEGKLLRAAAVDVPAPQPITGTWNLSFPPNWGAPPSVTLDGLTSWTDNTNTGVRYFSGTATYEKDIDISADSLKAGFELWLDLGTVKNFAEVSLNGQAFKVLWKPPFRLNITAAAKPGANHLVVKVTNLWTNRVIGDEQLPPDCEWDGDQLKAWPQWLLDGKPSPTGRLTFTTWHHLKKDSPLLASGLLGPVTLRTAEIIPAK